MAEGPPVRIVSLLPSATEMVCRLGLGPQLVGVTHECDFPAEVAALPKVTRTLIPHDASSREIDGLVRDRLWHRQALYTLDREVLERVRPDLLVTQTLCEVCAVAESEVTATACILPGQPQVVNLEPTRLGEVIESLRVLGRAAGVSAKADAVVAELTARVDAVIARGRAAAARPGVVLLEWIDPPFCAGHWSPELARLAGGVELIGDEGRPSRGVRWEEITTADPEVLVLACCGFSTERTLADVPILRSRPGFAELSCVRSGRVYVLDGSAYFSRPGPRLVDSLELLAHILHPSLQPLPAGLPEPIRLA